MVVDTSKETNSSQIHYEIKDNFSGEEGHAIDKMRVVYVEKGTPAEGESHLLSLTDGSVVCHSLPELQPINEVLDIPDFILDFEIYRNSSRKSMKAREQDRNYVVILSAEVNLKIYMWNNKSYYEHITKVPLELMSLPQQMRSAQLI